MILFKRIKTIMAGLILVLCCWFSSSGQAAGNYMLQAAIQHIIDTSGAKVGVAVTGLDFSANINVNSTSYYPMQSVFKFPLALAILRDADKGKLSLAQIVHVPKEQLDTHTWSPLVKDFPDRDLDITVENLLLYTVSKSDNNGCDILFRLAGGTAAVQQYVRSIGIKDMDIVATEAQMRQSWQVQYTNRSTPQAVVQLLKMFYYKQLLQPADNLLLMRLMTESENSPNRLKGMLPAHTIVAHKTGTSDTNAQGLTAATNDAGIVTLPDGRRYAIVVFVSDYKGGVAKGEHVIAEISKLVWDHFIQTKH